MKKPSISDMLIDLLEPIRDRLVEKRLRCRKLTKDETLSLSMIDAAILAKYPIKHSRSFKRNETLIKLAIESLD